MEYNAGGLIMNLINNILRFSLKNYRLLVLFIFLASNPLLGSLEQEITKTATNTIGLQYLAPYRKELKKLDTVLQSLNEYFKSNPTASEKQIEQYSTLVKARNELVQNITNHEILFTRFALNELLKGKPYTQLIDHSDYEHNLYVVCSPFDKEHDNYKENDHLLNHLAKHTQLKCGYIKWAKTLAIPTTDIEQLKQTQAVSQELLRDTDLREKLEEHLAQIKSLNLEDSFLSFWKDNENVAQVTAYAPYATNSNFGPVIEAMYAIIQARNGNTQWLQATVKKINQTSPYISLFNWTTFAQDASMIMLGISMLQTTRDSLVDTTKHVLPQWMRNGASRLTPNAVSTPLSYVFSPTHPIAEPEHNDFEYLGGWKIFALPVVIKTLQYLTGKVIDYSLKKRMENEYQTFTTYCNQNNQTQPQTVTISVGKIEAVYDNDQQARNAKKLVTQYMPHCKASLHDKKLVITLTEQEERTFRFAHPLMQHKTVTTTVMPCLAYLLIGKYLFNVPFFSYDTGPTIPFTRKALPVPGCLLLPWHLVKMLTCTGMLPAYAYQHFFKTPQKSMVSTTQSIQIARKSLLDFAQLINHVKQIQALLAQNPVIRANLPEIDELDAEKVVNQKLELTQKLLQQNEDFLEQQGISKADLDKTTRHFEALGRNLAKLLDTLQAHVNEIDDAQTYSWLSPIGFFKNLKLRIRFGSDDLLAAYQIMLSIRDTFAPWIEALGEVDRKLSEVALIREYEQKNVTFCFAEYEQQETPHLMATNIWLPHLLSKTQPENIIGNDIEMGGTSGQASTVILSGPTEGGKSTFERTLATAMLMAHTTGIVPATKWVATPFDRVLLSFNAVDNLGKTVTKTASVDTQTGTSGFRNEVESIKDIVTKKNALLDKQHALIIIDELFQKVQRSGEFFSEEVIRQNFVNNNCLNLIVSHREQPKKLEQETNGRCKNYRFVLKQNGDKLTNTYRIEPGALLRPDHKPVTLQEVVSNQEDAYNLQITQEAGILRLEPRKLVEPAAMAPLALAAA